VNAAFWSATKLTKALRAKGRKGPLHGLPMTVKESFDVAGWPTTRA